MVHDFQVSGSASAFCQGPQSHVRPVEIFFKGICSKLAQKRDNAAKGWGCAKASWKDPPRICWIKLLHLDIIVLLLCWELPLPQGDQISGWEMVTCQDMQPHLVSYIYKDKMVSLHSWLMIILSSGSDKYTILNCWDNEREIKIQQKGVCNSFEKAKWIIYMWAKSSCKWFLCHI